MILVTGGLGMIGAHTARALVDLGHEVVEVEVEARDGRDGVDPVLLDEHQVVRVELRRDERRVARRSSRRDRASARGRRPPRRAPGSAPACRGRGAPLER